jgi:hypothetical protein
MIRTRDRIGVFAFVIVLVCAVLAIAFGVGYFVGKLLL